MTFNSTGYLMVAMELKRKLRACRPLSFDQDKVLDTAMRLFLAARL
ncbi:hypothetical protein [Paraburkholderia sp. IW21]